MKRLSCSPPFLFDESSFLVTERWMTCWPLEPCFLGYLSQLDFTLAAPFVLRGIPDLAGVTTVSVVFDWLTTEMLVVAWVWFWLWLALVNMRVTETGTFFEVVCSWLLSMRFKSGRDFFLVEI